MTWVSKVVLTSLCGGPPHAVFQFPCCKPLLQDKPGAAIRPISARCARNYNDVIPCVCYVRGVCLGSSLPVAVPVCPHAHTCVQSKRALRAYTYADTISTLLSARCTLCLASSLLARRAGVPVCQHTHTHTQEREARASRNGNMPVLQSHPPLSRAWRAHWLP
jgi:hypothetical protein